MEVMAGIAKAVACLEQKDRVLRVQFKLGHNGPRPQDGESKTP
jgi:hypothetical protein